MSGSIFVIAEAGVNHNGDPDVAFKLVDAAVAAGANAVKFQTFKAENLVTRKAAKAKYQKQTTDSAESQFAMLKRLELSHKMHEELICYCQSLGIEFLSTAFDLESLEFLVRNLELSTLKIPSGEMTNGPLLLAHARTGCDLIISTGMCSLSDIRAALSVIAFGFIYGEDFSVLPSTKAFKEAFQSQQGQELLKQKVTLLHCTTEYPAPLDDVNLSAMQTLQATFSTKVGYSDHSEGITVPIAAAAAGASLIEKHFTLDKSLPGPDHKASLNPQELTEMIQAIRVVGRIMGDGIKEPKPSELGNIAIARKSLVAVSSIKKGECYTQKNIGVKRPGTGISPMQYWDFLGEESQKNYAPDELI